MLDYTKAAFSKIISDFRRIGLIFGVAVQIFYLSYLIYSLLTARGNFIINIILLIVSLSYLVYYVLTNGKIDKTHRTARKRVRRAYTYFKLLVRMYTLGVMIYSIYHTALNVTVISVILTALMATSWLIQIFVELIRYVIESKYELIITGIEADINKFKKPFVTAKNIIMFKRNNSDNNLKKPSKTLLFLEKKVLEKKERKTHNKEDNKADQDVI